ncbi:hypothetical protein PPYR_13938 [Photinus pyralis]|uniref:Uncharacterized protein n=1 Tax=Photinus pyralis TaxID=7054 RepID=A0A1Y1LUN4_PHOPY|nr:hypothetical protein PPYR_13938 [Photinus pyralis]
MRKVKFVWDLFLEIWPICKSHLFIYGIQTKCTYKNNCACAKLNFIFLATNANLKNAHAFKQSKEFGEMKKFEKFGQSFFMDLTDLKNSKKRKNRKIISFYGFQEWKRILKHFILWI